MSRAVSIHIGVNHPRDGHTHGPLQHSERTAWRMAELACRAGYTSVLVLRGEAATRQAVHDALSRAAGALEEGDTLLVSFSGHGTLERNRNGEERSGYDQSWCLHDGILLDDKLAGYWRLFDSGVRIVVVSESCYSGGMTRTGDDHGGPCATYGDGAPRMRVMRTPARARYRGDPGDEPAEPCVAGPSRDTREIRASVLMLAASTEHQQARDGVFTHFLLHEWDNGAFQGSYCELYRRVRGHVLGEGHCQEPQILMLGAPDAGFSLAPAFHVAAREPVRTLRDGGASRGRWRGEAGTVPPPPARSLRYDLER